LNWYVSRPVAIDERTYVVVEGTDPWNRSAFDEGPFGDHARWWLRLRMREQHLPWYRIDFPEQISGLRTIDVTPLDRALGLLLALYALWRYAWR
jgi:hypothetical protein